jgi:uncharacterized lipoprotein
VNRTSALRWSILVLLSASTLGGCSWFHHRNDYYAKAAETRPLDVPPDLDTPVTSNELIVPSASASSTSTSSTSIAPPSASISAGASSYTGSSTTLIGDGLHVADSPEHTWQRVGLALERAQVGTISARDESSKSYTVEVAGLGEPAAAAPEEHHWYTRVLHPFGGGSSNAKAQPVSGHLTVRVSQDKSGAKVNVEGDSSDSATATAARRVLEVLRERLS